MRFGNVDSRYDQGFECPLRASHKISELKLGHFDVCELQADATMQTANNAYKALKSPKYSCARAEF